jgi:hypothetical protein
MFHHAEFVGLNDLAFGVQRTIECYQQKERSATMCRPLSVLFTSISRGFDALEIAC